MSAYFTNCLFVNSKYNSNFGLEDKNWRNINTENALWGSGVGITILRVLLLPKIVLLKIILPTPVTPTERLLYFYSANFCLPSQNLNCLWNSHRDAWCIITHFGRISSLVVNPTPRPPPSNILHST